MITLYPYENLGHADHGWLEARHHFSFAEYRNPSRMQFGALRVINDDRIRAGAGFGMHAHENMEIITYVRAGAITHEDSLGNSGRTAAGDVQIMSVGTGVRHAEFNREPVDAALYQIWIIPDQTGVKPRWESRAFPRDALRHGSLPVLASGYEEDIARGALMIHQRAAIHGGRLQSGASLRQNLRHQAYILASGGSFAVNGIVLKQGDGAEAKGEKTLDIAATEDAEILVIDVVDQAA